MRLLILLVALVARCKSLTDHLLEEEPEGTQDYHSCICVPYWQCKDDFSGLLQDGVDIMDVRIGSSPMSDAPYGPCKGDFDVCCRVECGRRGAHLDNDVAARIHLGDDAHPGEFPWMLAVIRDRTYRCGASLIHPRVALTAAHCVDSPGPYKVRAGEWNWKTTEEKLPHQDRSVQETVLHHRYRPEALINDIALLVLAAPFQLAENVGVVCLAPPSPSTACTASGWGRSGPGRGTHRHALRKVGVRMVPREECTRALRDARLGPAFRLHGTFVCAGGGAAGDACKGDGGGPLVCPLEGTEEGEERYGQVGIVSWGLTCGVFDAPGVYVNVAMFGEWIDRHMERRGFDTSVYRY